MTSSEYQTLISLSQSGTPFNFSTLGVWPGTIAFSFIQQQSDVTNLAYGTETHYYDSAPLFETNFGSPLTAQAQAAYLAITKTSGSTIVSPDVLAALNSIYGTINPSYTVYYGDVANVQFTNVQDTSPSSAIQIGTLNDPAAAFFSHPTTTTLAATIAGTSVSGSSYDPGQYGDIWLNTGFQADGVTPVVDWTSATPGSLQFETLLHELGHALGLQHPTDYASGPPANNTLQFTIMTSAAEPVSGSTTIFAAGLQLDDIAAIQSIYGRNYDTRSESGTVYAGGITDGAIQAFGADKTKPFVYTVWDGGGDHDKIDASGYSGNAEIDLRQGHFSSIGSGSTFDSAGSSGGLIDNGNVAVAYHTVIEDATGTDQNDVLIGNDWNNILSGGKGADFLFGDGTLYDGQKGFETAGWVDEFGVSHSDPKDPNNSVPISGGDDTLIGGADNDILMAGAGANQIVCGGDAVKDQNGNITGSTDGGQDTYIISMATGDTASAHVGVSGQTATVSNSGGEANTTLYAIDQVFAQHYDATNTISLSPSVTSGLVLNDVNTDLGLVQAALALSFDGINVTTSPVQEVKTGSDVYVGGTFVGTFYNFSKHVGTAFNDTFDLNQVVGRSFDGGTGTDNDTVNYTGVVSGGITLAMDAVGGSHFHVSSVGVEGGPTDTLTSIETVVATNFSDTFQVSNLVIDPTLDGAGGVDTADFSGVTDGALNATVSNGIVTVHQSGSSAPADTLLSIEHINLTSGNDTVSVANAPILGQTTVIDGGDGTDSATVASSIGNFFILDHANNSIYNDFGTGRVEFDHFESISTPDAHWIIPDLSTNGSVGTDFSASTIGGTFKYDFDASMYTATIGDKTFDAAVGIGGNNEFVGTNHGDTIYTGGPLGTNMLFVTGTGNDTVYVNSYQTKIEYRGGDDNLILDSTHGYPTFSGDILMGDGIAPESVTSVTFGNITPLDDGHVTVDATVTVAGYGQIVIHNMIENPGPDFDPTIGLTFNGITTRVFDFQNGAQPYTSSLKSIYQGFWGDDSILAAANNDVTMWGYGGDDTLIGRGGNDTLFGGDGNDTLDGGGGSDTLYGGEGADKFIVTDAAHTVIADFNSLEGDTIVSSDPTLTHTVGSLRAGNDLNLLTGTDKSVTLTDFFSQPAAYTNLATFESPLWKVEIVDDPVNFLVDNSGALVATLDSNGGIVALDRNHATWGDDNLTGTSNDDTIDALGGNDTISGLAGNDTLSGGTGNDTLDGGSGNDLYVFADGAGQDIVTDASGNDTIRFDATVDAANILYTRSSDDLVIHYGTGTDSITVDNFFTSGAIEQVTFADGTVHNHAYISQWVQQHNIVYGTEGDDVLTGVNTPGVHNIIFGLGGDDTIYGGQSGDTIDAGTGTDTVFGGAGDDLFVIGHNTDDFGQFYGGGGHDVYKFTDNFDAFWIAYGGTGASDSTQILLPTLGEAQNIFVGSYDDVGGPFGYVYSDTTFGEIDFSGAHTKVMFGNDDMTLNFDNALIAGTTLYGGSGNDTWYGSGAGDNIHLGSGSNAVFETGGDNIIALGTGVDNISGGSGNDTYIAGTGDGQDVIADAGGNDTILFDGTVDPASVTYTQSGNDLIVHYGIGGDQITVTGFYDTSTSGAIEQFAFDQLPLAQNDSFTVNEDTVLTGNVMADNGNGADSDPDGDAISAAAGTFTTAHGGTVTLLSSGDFTYTPAANFNGADSFNYTLVDELNGMATGTVNIAVSPVNDAPVAKDDSFNASQNTLLSGNVLANNGSGPDFDVDGDTLSVTAGSFSTANGGAVSLSADGSFTYTSATGFSGDDTFTYTLLDGQGGSSTGTVNIAVGTASNHAPIAEDDAFTAAWGHTLSGNLLANNGNGADSDADNDTLQVVEASVTTAHGFVIGLSPNGDFSFTPPTDFVGTDSFSYTVSDGHGGSDTASVTLDVTAPAGAIVGTSGADNLSGTSTSNIIFGLDGDDAIAASGGNDTVYGGAGNDTLDGGSGSDMLLGGSGNDTYVVNGTGDVVAENANGGTDTVLSSISYTLTANVEHLALTGTANIRGTGNDLDNVITGNSGNNTLDGGLGADTLSGGLGNDTYVLDNPNDIPTENLGEGIDTIKAAFSYTLGAAFENLTLTGTGNFNATGNDGNNTITGNTGDNIIDGGVGADLMKGGLGNDTYYVDNAGDSIVDSGGIDTVITTVSYTLGNGIENLILAGDGDINGGGNNLANTITGNDGNNTITGSAGIDTIYGMDGNDVLNGNGGADVLVGGRGDDTYIVDNANDTLTEDQNNGGTDTVQSSVNWTLGNNFENLTLTGTGNIKGTGNADDNIIIGNSGNNSLDGGGGHDSLIGGLGDDTYIINNTGITIIENVGEGTDTVKSSISYTLGDNFENLTLTGTAAINGTGNDLDNVITGNSAVNTLSGLGGNDVLNGGGANDQLLGGDGNDTVYGNGGADTIDGGTGNDVLYGQAGADTLTGGSGTDTFAFQAGNAFSGTDKITDFSTAQGDKLDISDILTGFGFDPNSMHLGDWVHLTESGGNTNVSIDRDGLGTAYGFTNVVTLNGVTGLPDVDTMVANGNLVIHS